MVSEPFNILIANEQAHDSQLNAANDRVRRLEEHVSRTQTERQSFVEQLDQVREQRAQLQGRLQAQEVELSQTTEKKQSLLAQLEQMRLGHAQMEERIKRLEDRRDE